MPDSGAVYVERLSVRGRWWAVVLVAAAFGSTELFAGFTAPVIAVVLAAVLVPTLALLATTLRTRLVVDAEGIRAGRERISFDDMDSVQALDAPSTRLLLGPDADPAARLVVRGYIREAVLVRPRTPDPVPYWLISTRHPQQVVAAVEQAAVSS